MCVCVFKWLQSMQRPLFVPLLISVVCMYVFNIKFLPWKRDNRISPSYPFKHACLLSVCVFLCVSLVPHQALINCAHQVTFEKVLMGVSASEAKFPSPFSPFLPPLFSSPIYLISFYESCSSLHVISRMRHEIWPSPAARAGGGRATTASAELNVQDGVRGVWLTTDCLAVSKSFRQSGSRFLPPHPSCIGCLLPPAPTHHPRMKEVIPQLAFTLRMLPKLTAFFWEYGRKTITIVQSHNWFILHSGQDRCQNIFTAVN